MDLNNLKVKLRVDLKKMAIEKLYYASKKTQNLSIYSKSNNIEGEDYFGDLVTYTHSISNLSNNSFCFPSSNNFGTCR